MTKRIQNSNSEPKILSIFKVETKTMSSLYQKDLHEAFTDPNSYFKTNFNGHRIVFGNKSTKPPIILKTKNLKSQQLRQSRASINYNSINISRGMLSTSNNTQQSQLSLPPNKYYIDDKELKGIFANFRNIKEQNCQNDNQTIKSLIQNEEKAILQKQQKALSNHNIFNKTAKELSNNIAKKVKRKQDKLLMTTSTDFRIKKEQKDNYYNDAMLTEPIASYNWISSLRSDNGNRYINVGTVYNPTWQLIIVNKPKREIIRNPSRDTNNNDKNNSIKTKKSIYFYARKHSRAYSQSVNFKDLKVKGRDLLQFEYEIVKGLKGKKIISKYPRFEIDNYNNGFDSNNLKKKKLPNIR